MRTDLVGLATPALLAAVLMAVPPTTTAAPAPEPSTSVPTTSVPTTTVPGPALVETVIGTSVHGRPITAVHRSDHRPDHDAHVVVVIGVIHGDEDAGLAIVEELRSVALPANVDLHLIEAMNPDGLAAHQRGNANGVDLNRNFPYDWGPIGEPGNSQYAGTGPASEPETQAVVGFLGELRPDLVIWYHQDLYTVAPGRGRDGVVRSRYAELTGLPMEGITGGTYTGVAATWARHELATNEPLPGIAFIVELGATLTPAEAVVHAAAVVTVASESLGP